LAGYKAISILFLIVLVALAGGSPVFAQPDEAFLSFTPAAACPGATISISVNMPIGPADVVGGGISIAAVSPLADREVVVSSDPDGLVTKQECGPVVPDTTVDTALCTFVVSESASCGRYTVTVTLPADGLGAASVSGVFDVAGSCCAVGGCVQPVNTFTLLSPWLAVIGIVGCIGTIVVVAKPWRKPEN
jgi:hypothetical protein